MAICECVLRKAVIKSQYALHKQLEKLTAQLKDELNAMGTTGPKVCMAGAECRKMSSWVKL